MLLMVTVNDKGQSEDLLVNDEWEVRSYYHKQEVTIYKQNQLYLLWLYIVFHLDSNLALLFPSSITPIACCILQPWWKTHLISAREKSASSLPTCSGEPHESECCGVSNVSIFFTNQVKVSQKIYVEWADWGLYSMTGDCSTVALIMSQKHTSVPSICNLVLI